MKIFIRSMAVTLLFLFLFGFVHSYAESLTWPEKRRQITKTRELPEGLFGREDPFEPLEKNPEQPTQFQETPLRLNGIVWSEKSQSAFINSKLVVVGSEAQGYKVIKIRKDDVILEKEGKRYILSSTGLKEEGL